MLAESVVVSRYWSHSPVGMPGRRKKEGEQKLDFEAARGGLLGPRRALRGCVAALRGAQARPEPFDDPGRRLGRRARAARAVRFRRAGVLMSDGTYGSSSWVSSLAPLVYLEVESGTSATLSQPEASSGRHGKLQSGPGGALGCVGAA